MHDSAAALDPLPEIPEPPPSETRIRPKLIARARIRYTTITGVVIEVEAVDIEVIRPQRPRGFAAMTDEQRKAISAKGGASSHAKGTAHRFTSDAARVAGRKGGNAPHKQRGRLAGQRGAKS